MSEISIATASELVSQSVGFELSGMVIKRPLEWEECRVLVNMLGTMQRAIQWWAGDLMNYTEGRFGEDYAELFKEWAPHTLTQWKWVSRAVPLSRRREQLSWSAHVEVAGLDPEEQTRWLDMAIAEKWTRSDLRHALMPPEQSGDTKVRDEGRKAIVVEPEQEETITCPYCGQSFERGTDEA